MRIAFAAVVLLAAAPAIARPARLAASGSCTGVREAVIALAGHDPFTDDSPLAIAVEAEPTHATITVGEARRELTGDGCTAIVNAVALAIVIVLAEPEPEPEPEPLSRRSLDQDPSPSREVPPDEPEPAAPATRDHSLLLGVRSSRTIELGARLAGELGSIGFALALGGAEARDVGMGHIRVSRGEVELLPCLRAARAAACVPLAAGWIAGNGIDFDENRSAVTPYAAVGARAGWEQPLASWLAIAAYVEGRAALTSTRFYVYAVPAWTSPRVEGWLGIDLIAHMP